LSSTSFSTGAVAVAYAGGYVYVFAVKSADSNIAFRRATASAFGVVGSWSAWTNIAPPGSSFGSAVYGVGAAAVSGSKIAIATAPIDGGPECLGATATVTGSGSVTGWSAISGCAQAGFSAPAMMSTGSTGTNGARMVVETNVGGGTLGLSTATSSTGTWSSLTAVPMAGCAATSSPAITEHSSAGKFILATTCNGSEDMSWRVVTP
jgi:hypothetical protein